MVHGAIGDKDVLVRGVIRDVAMMGFARRVIGCGYGVGTDIGGSRERRADGRLYGQCEGGGVRQHAAGPLRRDCEVTSAGVW